MTEDIALYLLTKNEDGTFTLSTPVDTSRDERQTLSGIGDHIVRREKVRLSASLPPREVKVYIEPLSTIELAYIDQETLDELFRA